LKKSANADNDNLSKPAGHLNLFDNNWTDLDGDGTIDLVQVDSYDKAAVILLLVDGQWKEIVKIK